MNDVNQLQSSDMADSRELIGVKKEIKTEEDYEEMPYLTHVTTSASPSAGNVDAVLSTDDSEINPEKKYSYSDSADFAEIQPDSESDEDSGEFFECTVCGGKCTSIAGLRSHSVVHVNELRYARSLGSENLNPTTKKMKKQKKLLDSGQLSALPEKMKTLKGLCDIDDGHPNVLVLGDSPLTSEGKRRQKPQANVKCHVCGKEFTRVDKLAIHISTHTGEQLLQCELCDKRFSTSYLQRCHMSTHTGEKRFYACNMCSKTFKSCGGLKYHSSIHAEENPFKCPNCGHQLSSKQALKSHVCTKHLVKEAAFSEKIKASKSLTDHLDHSDIKDVGVGDFWDRDLSALGFDDPIPTHLTGVRKRGRRKKPNYKTVACRVCGEELKGEDKLTVHSRTQTINLPFLCQLCDEHFTTAYLLRCHTRIHTGEKPYACTTCGKTFTSSGGLRYHSTIPDCRRRLGSKQSLKSIVGTKYLLEHIKDKSYIKSNDGSDPLSKCEVPFALEKNFSVHTNVKQGRYAQTFECNICNRILHTATYVKYHMRLHTGDKPFKCGKCNDRFALSSALKSHMRRHSEERPFLCSICEKTFKTQYLLKIHTRVHTGEKPYPCTMCDKRFGDLNVLKNHSQIKHSFEKPHVCSVCGKSFSVKGYLRTHMQMHRNEKSYKCKFCEKSFNTVAGRSTHTKNVHQADNVKFNCEVCNKSFSRRNRLRDHLRQHLKGTEEISFACVICGVKCKTLAELVQHEKDDHDFF